MVPLKSLIQSEGINVKITSYVKKTISFWRYISPEYAYMSTIGDVVRHVYPQGRLNGKIIDSQISYRKKWLRKYYSKELSQWRSMSESAVAPTDVDDMPIWFCWFQGKSTMPELQRCLYRRLLKNSGNHRVIFVDMQYIIDNDIVPQNVLDGFNDDIIGPAFFSDIVRVCLLERFGGLWVDSTLLIAKEIPDSVFEYPMYNVKGLKDFPFSRNVPDGLNWQSYFLGSFPHSLFVTLLKEMLLKYTSDKLPLIDYFLVFYLAQILREDIPCICKEFAEIPDNNVLCEQLGPGCESLNNQDIFLNILHSDTYVFKLSRHIQYNNDILKILGVDGIEKD